MLGAAVALLAGCGADRGAAVAPSATEATHRVPLTISTAHGLRRFSVEVARTEAEQERGLMFRTALPKDGGMIFPINPPRPATFSRPTQRNSTSQAANAHAAPRHHPASTSLGQWTPR